MSSSFAKGSRRAAAAVSRSRTNLTKTQAVEAFLAKAAQPLRKSNNNNSSSSSSNTRRFNHEESTTPERRRGANATPKGKYHKGRDASRGIEFHKGFNTTTKSHHQNTTSSANLRTPSILHHSSSSSTMSSANRLFVSCIKGLEPLLEAELKELGFEDTNQAYSGVYVNINNNNNNSNKSEDSSDSLMRAIYKLNYQSRIATRVLLPLQQVQCNNRDELYNAVYDSIDWRKYVPRGKTFAIDSNLIKTHTSLNHSLFAAQVMKDGIVDQYRKRTDNSYRPTVSVQNPDVQLNLFITKTSLLNNMNNNNSTNNNNNNNNTESARENRDTREDNNDFTAMISLDTSRTPLFKRGYRVANVAAPLQEHLAAAILRITDLENRVAEFQKTSGGEKDFTFCDPFCGSGTFLAEAAMILKRVPPGYIRGAHPDAYGFSHLEQFDEDAYRKCKEEADAQMLPQLQGVRFIGIDKDAEALKATKQNLLRSGLFKQADKYGRMENVELVHSDFRNYMTRSILMNAAATNATTSVMDDTLTNRFINLMVTNPPYGVRIGDNRGGGDEEDLKQLYGKIGDFMKKLCAVNSKGFVITWSPDLAKSVGLKTTRRHILYNGGMETRLLEYNLY